ncbi:MAG: globin domain-containing protein [Cyclobacteriaceae bacterium]
MPNSSPTIVYRDINKEIRVDDPRLSILELAIRHKIPHLHECGGHGLCTTCRIRVLDGASNLSPPTAAEVKFSQQRGWDPSVRLACQTRINEQSAAIERLVWTSAEVSNLQLETMPLGIGEERELAFLFCDMRNFTPWANRHSNFDLAHMLNRFFTALGDPVFMNNGIIYQYAGDEIIALFGAGGGDQEQMCLAAVRAALGMLYAVERLNRWELKEFDTTFSIGIGLHYGKAFVGNIGHSRHKQFAVIGDPVNVTSRIQSQNKALETTLLASHEFITNLPEKVLNIGKKSKVLLKGKDELFSVYEIVGFTQPDTNLRVQSTIDELLKNEEAFAEQFYQKLFLKAPEVQALFPQNMLDQGRMLTHMLRGIVYALSRPDYLVSGLNALGKQHREYGVKHEHYPLVKDALLETIREHLGEESFSPETERAWHSALDLVIKTMDG